MYMYVVNVYACVCMCMHVYRGTACPLKLSLRLIIYTSFNHVSSRVSHIHCYIPVYHLHRSAVLLS